MSSITGLFRGNLVRSGGALALAAFMSLVSIAPASAQVRVDNGNHNGWDKNGKAERKAEKKAQKQAARLGGQRTNGGVVVNNNGTVIDRARVRPDGSARPNGNNRAYTNNNRNGYTYRNGYYYDRNGNRVYDYRNGNVDPYAAYPQYRQGNYGYNNSYPYGNSSYNNGYPYGNSNPYYYDNREGDKDRDDVARAASQNGYYAGFQRGQYDAQQRNRANPQGHGAYQFGYDGFDPSWGSSSTYQQYYRQYFVQGYNDGYSQRGYTRSFPRRQFRF